MYLDPGFGGMLVQVLVAIIAAGGIILFSLRRKIRVLFSKKKATETSNAGDPDVGVVNDGATDSDVGDVIDMLSEEKATDDKPTDEESAEKNRQTNNRF